MKMQSRYAVAACLIAMVLLLMGTEGQAMTFTASDISHTAALTQDETTFLAATSSDSFYAAGVVQFTGATASATSLVIGRDVPLFRNAANQLRVQAGLSVQSATSSDSLYVTGLQQNTGATASATALVLGNDVPLFRSAANRLTVQAGVVANQATSSDSLYVAGVAQFTGSTASGTAVVIGGDVPLFRSAANTLTIQGTIALQNGETFGNSTNDVVFLNTTTFSVATNTATTTPGLWVSQQAGSASTTTLIIGGGDELTENPAADGCIQLWRNRTGEATGKFYKVYVNSAGTGLVVAAGTCRDN